MVGDHVTGESTVVLWFWSPSGGRSEVTGSGWDVLSSALGLEEVGGGLWVAAVVVCMSGAAVDGDTGVCCVGAGFV